MQKSATQYQIERDGERRGGDLKGCFACLKTKQKKTVEESWGTFFICTLLTLSFVRSNGIRNSASVFFSFFRFVVWFIELHDTVKIFGNCAKIWKLIYCVIYLLIYMTLLFIGFATQILLNAHKYTNLNSFYAICDLSVCVCEAVFL